MFSTLARPRQAPALQSAAFVAALTLLQSLLLLLLLADIAAASKAADPRWPTGIALTAALFVFNALCLRHFARTLHFSWLYARWPGPVALGGAEAGTLAEAAREAFLAGDWQRCVRVLERVEFVQRSRHWRTAVAACRLNLDDLEGALAAYLEAPADRLRARWLQTRSWALVWQRPPYFSAQDRQPPNAGRWRKAALASLLLGGADLLVQGQLFWGLWARARQGFSSQGFKEQVSGDFILHYHRAEFIEEVLPLAQAALSANLDFLGLPRDSFEHEPIHLYLCDSQKEYLARSPFTLDWEAASAVPEKNSIYLYPPGPGQPLDLILAHELNHLCFHRMIPFSGQGSWLVEGLAEYVAYHHALEKRGFARDAFLKANNFKVLKERSLPFSDFLSENPRESADKEHIHLFYVQGFSIVYVLIDYYGKKAFFDFMRDYARSRSIQASLAKAYPTIKDADGLRAAWSLFMLNGG